MHPSFQSRRLKLYLNSKSLTLPADSNGLPAKLNVNVRSLFEQFSLYIVAYSLHMYAIFFSSLSTLCHRTTGRNGLDGANVPELVTVAPHTRQENVSEAGYITLAARDPPYNIQRVIIRYSIYISLHFPQTSKSGPSSVCQRNAI